MSRVAAATIVAKPYLAFARVLARSFRAWHPDVPFFVFVADELDGRIDPRVEPFEPIAWDEVDVSHRERLRFHYAMQPLSYACTPWLLAHLLARGYERVLFFKQETRVLASVAPLFERLQTASILLTPHLLEPPHTDAPGRELNILLSGTFNVGVLGVRQSPDTARFLSWWQDRLARGCRHDVGAGMHFEQRWLDLVPAYFDGVAVLRDVTCNVAHWNLPDRRVSLDAHGRVLVNGEICRVFRFSGFDPEQPTQITRYNTRLDWQHAGAVRSVFEDFHRRLMADSHGVCRHWPYAWDRFDNGVRIPDLARWLYLNEGDGVERFGDPLQTGPATSYWRWLTAPSTAGGKVSRLWMAVRGSRPDLQQAFPEVPGVDEDRFLTWAAASGLGEHAIPAAMLDVERG